MANQTKAQLLTKPASRQKYLATARTQQATFNPPE
jgi:hypothetical protein